MKAKAGLLGMMMLVSVCAQATVVVSDFDGLPRNASGYGNGSDGRGGFYGNCMFFHNDYNATFGSWSGFAYSLVNDTNTAGFGNQYAVWTPGTDVSGNGLYTVVFDASWKEADIVDFAAPSLVRGFYVNNTTYAALDMLNGSGFSKKFGGDSGDDPDWFKLTVTGKDENGVDVGSVDFYLADYRFADNTQDYIVSDWTWVDLTPLGAGVKSLHFELSSSDNGTWGMNTPAYFAMDELTVVATPEAAVVNFDSLPGTDTNYWNGSDLSYGFITDCTRFYNSFNTNYGSWNGFAYSWVNDTNTAGYGNQYAAWAPGVDVSTTGKYAVVYDSAWDEFDVIEFCSPTPLRGMYINNTTYAALDMLNGSGFSKKFGGASGDDPDWFKLTITGRDKAYNLTGTVEFYLADYRFADNSQDYIVSDWTWVDLTSLGSSVKSLHFELSSSDNGTWGMNTPAYFAMDDLTFMCNAHGRRREQANDYDASGTSDLAVFDSATGRWFFRSVAGADTLMDVNWGWPGVQPVAGDYNGDGAGDMTVFDSTTGRWFIRKIEGDVIAMDVNWGWPGVKPVSGDYNGDGIDDLAVFDSATGRWFIRGIDGTVLAMDVNWGWPGVKPVSGDFDGDGSDDLAVFDSATGNWFIRALDGRVIAWDVNWGWPGAQPVSGDFDGDGTADLAVFDSASGNWFIRKVDGTVIASGINWGWHGTQPVSGDFDGDGIDDLAVFDSATGNWFIRKVDGTVIASGMNWGWSSVMPVGE